VVAQVVPAFTRPRDSQRSRLYRAEDELEPGRRLPTVAVLQGYVDDLAASDWFTARWGARSFDVRPGHGHRRATADRNGVLQLPLWSRTELVVLHEVAHCLTPERYAAHGPEYAGVFLSLVRRRLGPGAAQVLEDAFARHRVRWVTTAVARPALGVVGRGGSAARRSRT
jgi:putative metallohydrolase (TIGR04338 family)